MYICDFTEFENVTRTLLLNLKKGIEKVLELFFHTQAYIHTQVDTTI